MLSNKSIIENIKFSKKDEDTYQAEYYIETEDYLISCQAPRSNYKNISIARADLKNAVAQMVINHFEGSAK